MLEITDLGHSYGRGGGTHLAVDKISLKAEKGEIVSIVGASGCGKSTVLRCIAGLQRPTRGTIRVNGAVVDAVVPEGLAVVFQDYSRSLYPWLSVRDNVALPLVRTQASRAQRRRTAENALEAVGLGGTGHRYPWQLSGGMQQRVAIARALAYRPDLLLMDEPFASVDAQTRFELEDLILRVRDEFGVTVVFVTHDIDEAIYLADRIVVLSTSPGRVAEIVGVALPRPRDQIATKADEAFARYREHLLGLVMSRR